MKLPLFIIRFNQLRKEKRRLFVLLIILLIAFFIAGTITAIYVCRVYYIKTYGLVLTPTKDYEIHDIEYYLQNDPAWGDERLGRTDRRLAGAGCLIACVSSAATDLGVQVTPKELNQKLTEIDGFQGAELIWYKINEVYPEIDYKYSRIFRSATIEADLKSGLLPIINVKYKGDGITHWLLVIGAKDGEFLVYDPLNAERAPMKLSAHGRVYAYRVLIPSTH